MTTIKGERYIQKSGLRPTNGQDILDTSNDIYDVYKSIFDGIGDCILSGMNVVGGNEITEGTMIIEGEAARFSGATGLTFPVKLKLQKTEVAFKAYADSATKATRELYEAVIDPTGTFEFPVSGGLRFEGKIFKRDRSVSVDTNGTGWRRVAKCEGNQGEGKCIVHLYNNLLADSTLETFLISTTTDGGGSTANGLEYHKVQAFDREFRLIRDANNSYLECKFDFDYPTGVKIEVININEKANWEPYSGILPNGDLTGMTIVFDGLAEANTGIVTNRDIKCGNVLGANIKKATLWQNATLNSGYTTVAGNEVRFRLNEIGQLELDGYLAYDGVAADTAFTLPLGHRPEKDVIKVIAGSNNNVTTFTVRATGAVESSSWVTTGFNFLTASVQLNNTND